MNDTQLINAINVLQDDKDTILGKLVLLIERDTYDTDYYKTLKDRHTYIKDNLKFLKIEALEKGLNF